MTPTLASDIVLWVVGGLSLIAFVSVVGAFWSLGRSGYRKD
jgi:hypothetical protein